VISTLLGLSLNPTNILNSLSPYGEIGVMVIVFAETGLLLGFFLPGDSLLFTAGVLAAQSATGSHSLGPTLDIGLLLPLCFVGAFLGSEVGYVIGKHLGPRLFTKPNSRLFKQEYVERTREFFERHGPKTIVIARFVPIVRTFTPIMAGVGSMQRRVYSIYNLIGALIWAVGITMLGWVIGDAIGKNIDTYLLPLIALVIAISLIPPAIEWRRARRTRASKLDPEAEAHELEEILNPDD